MLKKLFKDDYELLVNNSNLLEKTLIIVEKVFRDIVDKQGKAYIGHLIRVSNRVSTLDEKVVALLHDIIEDTEVTVEDLLEIGYEKHIVEAVDILSKRDDMKHLEYIELILNSKNDLAIRVKKADLEDNSDEVRLSALDEQTRIRLREKFRVAYKMVCEYLNEEEERHVRY